MKLAPKIPIEPMPGFVILRQIKIVSRKEKELKEKNILPSSKEDLNKMLIRTMREDGPEKVYDEHPDQAEVVAIRKQDAEMTGLQVGDVVVFNDIDGGYYNLIFNKKLYIAYRVGSLIVKYLTAKR